jgi:hypothetical protein
MNLLVLPFYKDIASQVAHGRCGNYPTAVISPPDRFLPFVLRRPATGQGLDCVRVIDFATGRLFKTIQPADFPCTVYTDRVWDYYTYFGNVLAGLNMPCGLFYLEVKDYVSEVFEVRTNMVGLLRIEWGNASNIAQIPYSQGFLQRMYLDTKLAEPDYKHDEDGNEDGDKVFVALQHRLTKTYKAETLPLPEFLVDVLSSLAIHSIVNVDNKLSVDETGLAIGSWSSDSCAALTTLSFSERPVTAQRCATDDGLELVDTSDYEPKPWLCNDDSNKEPFWENTGETRCVTSDAVYRSSAISELVTRTNCADGETPGQVIYTLQAGYSVSVNNQKEADDEARKYFDANKDAYANKNAECFEAAPVEVNRSPIYEATGCFSGRMNENGQEVPATSAEYDLYFVRMASDNIYYCTYANFG